MLLSSSFSATVRLSSLGHGMLAERQALYVRCTRSGQRLPAQSSARARRIGTHCALRSLRPETSRCWARNEASEGSESKKHDRSARLQTSGCDHNRSLGRNNVWPRANASSTTMTIAADKAEVWNSGMGRGRHGWWHGLRRHHLWSIPRQTREPKGGWMLVTGSRRRVEPEIRAETASVQRRCPVKAATSPMEAGLPPHAPA